MMKLFADRQLNPAPDVIPFLTKRIDRSFAAAQNIVTALDKAGLDAKRPLTRAFAAAVLERLMPEQTHSSDIEEPKVQDAS